MHSLKLKNVENVVDTFPTLVIVRFRKDRLETEALRHDTSNVVRSSSGGYSWALLEACAASLCQQCVVEVSFLFVPATTCHPIHAWTLRNNVQTLLHIV